ncbi:GNAT family N-acetyltransferase [Peribacillus frigoritolerans]|uniref:GNAT family N-acetyltransferase n=1 Tax=Peribacillus frigoritolerans TaxID=450367 RepID=UPI0039A112D6
MQLYFYDDRFENAIEYYELNEEQLHYTGQPKDCIKLSNEDSERYSILAMEEDKLVTFFVLHRNEGVKPYSNNNNSILLRAFSTDSRHQGKGYAKKALMLLPEFVKENFSGTNEIVLAVNLKNEAAQGLYKKCGFVDEGVRRMGKKGELIIMSCHLYSTGYVRVYN